MSAVVALGARLSPRLLVLLAAGLLAAGAIGWLTLPPASWLPLGGLVAVAVGAFILGRLLGWSDRWMVIAIPMVWLLVFFLVPFVVLGRISLSETVIARPPYSPLWERGPDGQLEIIASLQNYWFILGDSLYRNAYLSSIRIAGSATATACGPASSCHSVIAPLNSPCSSPASTRMPSLSMCSV